MGEALYEFQPSHCIRQVDPLSLYLSGPCLERLFHLIGIAVGDNRWIPIPTYIRGPKVSHLAFAYGFFFAKANIEKSRIIKDIL